MIEETTLAEHIMQVFTYMVGAIALGLSIAYIIYKAGQDKK